MIVSETDFRVSVRATREFRDMLRDNRIFTDDRLGQDRWAHEPVVTFNKDCEIEPYTGFFRGEALCSFGAFSYSWTPVPPRFTAGRYCSIAGGVRFPGAEHPVGALSTSPVFYDRKASFVAAAMEDMGYGSPWGKMPFKDKPFPSIGNDVWLTAEAALGPGVHVGNGTVVMRAAMVTRSLPAYRLAGGMPATADKLRFDGDLGDRLLATEWWQYSPADLKTLPVANPTAFVEAWEGLNTKPDPWTPPKLRVWAEVQRIA
ncbi:LbetaH domain-containing protein [Roseomonas elaeocarpi]|uniref:Uncharacterized protein n=1 Tax=Roseomonas elaeocarpi TaxID=907779 RepID=A0ABV6JRH6_9PROT